MYKQFLSATAIALALGLQGCGIVPTTPKINTTGAFDQPDVLGGKGLVAEKVGIADAALAAGDTAGAIRMYRDLAREYPFSLEPRIKLGSALLEANAPQEAARVYEGANKLNPSYEGMTGAGRVYLALRQPGEALEAFDRAVQMRKDDAAAMNGQGVALDQLGRHLEAQKIYLAILDKDPSDIKVRSNYALSLAFSGKYDDAADILNSLAQVPGADAKIRENLALVYGLAGNPGQAAHFGRMDLDEDSVNSNLKYYGAVRGLNAPKDKSAELTRPSAAGSVPPATGPFDAVQTRSSPEPTASDAGTKPVPELASRTIKPRGTHAAEKPVLGEAGIKPVIVAQVEPARSAEPAQVLAPAKSAAETPKVQPNSASKEHRRSLVSLPMTRAEAAAEEAQNTSSAVSDDVVPMHKEAKPKSAEKPSVNSVAAPDQSLTIASALLQEDLKPASAPARSHTPAVPAVTATGVTASLEPRAAAVPAVAGTQKLARAAKQHASAAAVTVDANPVDTGARAPAVPAML